MSYPKLTAKGWGEIPDGYDWFVVNFEGNKYASKTRPDCLPRMKVWAAKEGFIKIGSIGSVCHDWANSLQQRPTPAEQPATAPTLPVSNVRLSPADFDRIAADFGLHVRDCGTYRDAVMYNPGGFVSIVFVCDAPPATEFDDTGIELLVRTYEKIKI